MAPTICSDKKQQQHARPHHHHQQHQQQHHQQHQQQQQQQNHQQQLQQQLRIRDLRRRRHGVTMRHIITKPTNVNLSNQLQHHQQQQQIPKATNASNTFATSTNAATATTVSTTTATTSSSSSFLSSSSSTSTSSLSSMSSNVVSFAIKGSMNSTMSSSSSLLPTSSSPSLAPFRLRLRGRRAELLRAQISDNAVSSSTHLEDEDSNILPQRTLSESTTVSPNDSDSDMGCAFLTDSTGDSDTTMDMDSDAENIHAVMVDGIGLSMYRLRHHEQLSATVLKAKETKQQEHQLPLAKLSGNNKDEHYHASPTTCNTAGLLGIALKTIRLVQRNQLLQKRLAQLQVETSEFIASVLANPENQHFREKITENTESSKPSKQYNNNGNKSNMLLKNMKH